MTGSGRQHIRATGNWKETFLADISLGQSQLLELSFRHLTACACVSGRRHKASKISKCSASQTGARLHSVRQGPLILTRCFNMGTGLIRGEKDGEIGAQFGDWS